MEKDWAAIFGAEFDYIKRLGTAIVEPEEKRSFWETVKRRKQENQKWSIYDDFPPASDQKRIAMKYCGEILETLRGRNVEPKEGE